MADSSTIRWNPDKYEDDAAFVTDLADEILHWLDAQPGESILDLGCGDGRISRRLMDAGCSVVGIDSSREMVLRARARGIDARAMDAQLFELDQQFDAAFSNAALHWMPDASAVAKQVRDHLRTGGRFVAEFGGKQNTESLIEAVQSAHKTQYGVPLSMQFYFPDETAHRNLLERNGFRVDRIERVPRPTPLPDGLGNWLEVFLPAIIGIEKTTPDFIKRVTQIARDKLFDEATGWWADYVRLRFEAIKT